MHSLKRQSLILLAGTICVGSSVSAQRVASSIDPAHETPANAESLLLRAVTVELNKASLREAVDRVAASAGVSILYRRESLESSRKRITFRATKSALSSVMNQVLAGTPLRLVVVKGGQLVLEDVSMELRTTGVVTGKILDATTKRPVSGAAISLKGGTFSARTDDAGTFRMANVPSGEYTLVVRRLGYAVVTKIVTVNNGEAAVPEILLAQSATALDEVVTTMTGPQRRMELGNAVTRISNVDSIMKEAPVTTLSQLLTSRVPGMIVSQAQGTVGGDVRLQIRGMTSLKGSSEPIVVVDGIRYQSSVQFTCPGCGEGRSPLNDINPNDIESIEVVKGPSAATLYGPDASNGVIVITTKIGKAGPPRWTVFGKRMFDRIPTNTLRDTYTAWGQRFRNFSRLRCAGGWKWLV